MLSTELLDTVDFCAVSETYNVYVNELNWIYYQKKMLRHLSLKSKHKLLLLHTCYFFPFSFHVDVFKASLDVTLEKFGGSLEKWINISIGISLFEVVQFS